jgi:hypothetical protein
MLGLDTEAQERHRRGAIRESQIDERKRNLEQEIRSNTITVESDAGRDVTNLLAQMGRPLTCQQVIDRLKLANSNLIFEQSKSDSTKFGIYIMHDERTPAGTWEKRKVFICGMEAGVMPEFTVKHVTFTRVANPDLLGNETPTREIDWLKVPTFLDETRGWRTVLLRLLHQGMITRWHVERYFSWTPTHDSKNWQAQT